MRLSYSSSEKNSFTCLVAWFSISHCFSPSFSVADVAYCSSRARTALSSTCGSKQRRNRFCLVKRFRREGAATTLGKSPISQISIIAGAKLSGGPHLRYLSRDARRFPCGQTFAPLLRGEFVVSEWCSMEQSAWSAQPRSNRNVLRIA
jgi:hypothetical protein